MIAWLTHHLPRPDDAPAVPGLLPGRYAGGAEMTDAAYLAAAPEPVTLYGPDQWRETVDADLIIVTGTDALTAEAMLTLAERHPVVFLHHAQTRSAERAALLNGARRVIVHTPAHEQHERRWLTQPEWHHVLSPLDVTEIRSEPQRQHLALWAQRSHPLKNRLGSAFWAAQHGLPFVAMTDADRADVLAAMATAEWFVHLPLALESESRAVMEAVLSGCRVHVNAHVGIASVERWDDPAWLAEQVSTAADEFWRVSLA